MALTKNTFNPFLFTSSLRAYNKWASHYDDEEDNLMLLYDSKIQELLLSSINIKDKFILDYGCGTGRNWNNILKKNPEKITGCDISKEMLKRLKDKFPNADVHLLKKNELSFAREKSIDLLLSTLVLAHIKNVGKLFVEWDKILKLNSDIVLTDFHPDLLERGGERTFRHEGALIKIRNYEHKISDLQNLLAEYGFKTILLIEQRIDEEVRSFYERHNALKVYDKFYGVSFIYGLHLQR